MITLGALAALTCLGLPAGPLPVRGLHLLGVSPNDVDACAAFIKDVLPKEGINTLVLEVDYNFAFKTHPEIAMPGALSAAQIKKLVDASHEAHIKLIPQVNLLGHQSWDKDTFTLLTKHPEFDETPGKFPGNKGLYCRSYCPLAPGVHEIVFDLIDEVAEAFQADAVHVGMDEVMTLADPDCKRCHGKSTAELFGNEVTAIHDHLAKSKRTMWMWGDRFIDGKASGIGDWEASGNGTQTAIDMVPKDIVICDWHYDQAEPTAAYFAMHGFNVISCPWRKPQVAVDELQQIQQIRTRSNNVGAPHAYGMMETTWCDAGAFMKAYNGDKSARGEPKEVVACFKAMCAAMKAGG